MAAWFAGQGLWGPLPPLPRQPEAPFWSIRWGPDPFSRPAPHPLGWDAPVAFHPLEAAPPVLRLVPIADPGAREAVPPLATGALGFRF